MKTIEKTIEKTIGQQERYEAPAVKVKALKKRVLLETSDYTLVDDSWD